MLINIFLLSCCFGCAVVCICWERLPGTWSVGLLKRGVQASLLSIGDWSSQCFTSSLHSTLLFERVFVYTCSSYMWVYRHIRAPHLSTLSVCTGADGPGMPSFRALTWCPPTADGVNHRPFWAWLGFENAGYMENQWVQLLRRCTQHNLSKKTE